MSIQREDLGEMLEKQVGSWARHGDVAGRDSEDIDDIFRWAAEAFWNDVIDVLMEEADNQHIFGWGEATGVDVAFVVRNWLEGQKIEDDE